MTSFDLFGTTCELRAEDADVAPVRELWQRVHDELTCFDERSELMRLNADPRASVPAGPIVRRFAESVRWAALASDGLVDATLAPGPRVRGLARFVRAGARSVQRPPGIRLDSGGLGKGLAVDLAAERLMEAPSFAVDAGGDLRVGGSARRRVRIDVEGPEGAVVHHLLLAAGAVATSGTTRRGAHIIDPRTGAPAASDLVQVTAVAPTGVAAEMRAKAALLSGTGGARRFLSDGGVLVHASGDVEVVA